MFLLIEIDKNFTLGIDWYRYSKGIRLGFIGIHICKVNFSKFIDICVQGAIAEKSNN